MNFLSHGKCNNYVVMLNNVVHVDVVVVRQTRPLNKANGPHVPLLL